MKKIGWQPGEWLWPAYDGSRLVPIDLAPEQAQSAWNASMLLDADLRAGKPLTRFHHAWARMKPAFQKKRESSDPFSLNYWFLGRLHESVWVPDAPRAEPDFSARGAGIAVTLWQAEKIAGLLEAMAEEFEWRREPCCRSLRETVTKIRARHAETLAGLLPLKNQMSETS